MIVSPPRLSPPVLPQKGHWCKSTLDTFSSQVSSKILYCTPRRAHSWTQEGRSSADNATHALLSTGPLKGEVRPARLMYDRKPMGSIGSRKPPPPPPPPPHPFSHLPSFPCLPSPTSPALHHFSFCLTSPCWLPLSLSSSFL